MVMSMKDYHTHGRGSRNGHGRCRVSFFDDENQHNISITVIVEYMNQVTKEAGMAVVLDTVPMANVEGVNFDSLGHWFHY